MVSSYGVGIMGSSTEWSRAQESGYEKVQNEFGTLPYNCVDLDKQLKKINKGKKINYLSLFFIKSQ